MPECKALSDRSEGMRHAMLTMCDARADLDGSSVRFIAMMSSISMGKPVGPGGHGYLSFGRTA